MNNEHIPKVVTVEECANITGISQWSIRRWIKENRFPVIKTGRKVLINLSRFVDFLEAGTGEGTTSPAGIIPENIDFR